MFDEDNERLLIGRRRTSMGGLNVMAWWTFTWNQYGTANIIYDMRDRRLIDREKTEDKKTMEMQRR